MRRACRPWACVAVVVGSLVFAGTAPAEERPERIAELIKELDADEFQAREQAAIELQRLGDKAQAALEKVVKESQSAEARARAEGLLKTIALAKIRKNALQLTDFFTEAKRANEGQLDAERLDALVARLVEMLAAEAKQKDLKPPVQVKEVGAGERVGMLRNALVIQKNGTVPFSENSVILFATAGHVSHARNSIVIAPLGVDVSSAENSIILAGLTANVSFARGGIVLSGGDLELSHADGSFLGAGQELRTNVPQKAFFVNSTPVERVRIPAREGSLALQVEGLELKQEPRPNPLEGKLSLTYMAGGTSGFILFTLPDGRGEYVARTGEEIRTPERKPLEGLEGWKLIFCGGRIAMLEKGDEISLMRIAH